MTKSEIVLKIARETAIEKGDINKVVESFIKTVKNAIINGDEVTIRGFATIGTVERAEKKARHIAKGECVIVPAHKVVRFKPANDFKKAVAEI